MRRRSRSSLAASAFTLACGLGGCAWEEIDALAPGGGGSGYDASTTSPDAGLDAGAAQDVTTGDVSDGDASTDGGSDGDAGLPVLDGDVTSNVPCNSGAAPLRLFPFDADSEGWVFLLNSGASGGLAWTGDAGNPSPGAIEVAVTSYPPDGGTTSGGWAEFQATPLGNLSGRTLSAWVWLESGTAPNLKIFVQTGSQYVWADNGTVRLLPRTWTCVSLAISNPSYTNGPDYDPQNVVRLGLELLGPTPFRVYVDSVGY